MSNKQTVVFHEECLENSTAYLKRLEEELEHCIKYKKEQIEKTRIHNEFYAKQIAEAKRRGLDSFDGERFLKPRKKDE